MEYAPEVKARAAKMAFLLTWIDRPLRITLSMAATRSEKTISASCSPASTVIISELGFVYFLLRIDPKKTVKVFLCKQNGFESAEWFVPRVHSRQLGLPLLLSGLWTAEQTAEDAPK